MMRVSKRNEREGRGEGRRACVRACVLSFTSTYPPMKSAPAPELVMRHGEMVAGVLFLRTSTASSGVVTSFVAAAGDRSQHMRPMTAAPLRMAERCMMSCGCGGCERSVPSRARRSERGVPSVAFRAWRSEQACASTTVQVRMKEEEPVAPRGPFVERVADARDTLSTKTSRALLIIIAICQKT